MEIITADLWDGYADQLTVLNLELKQFGKKDNFSGEIVTLKVHEDNSYVKKLLSEDGTGKVLVIDGGGSRRCALIGDNIAKLAMDNNWSGVIVYGCIRDSKVINTMEVGIKAIGTCPVKTVKRNVGLVGEGLLIEGTKIQSGHYIYADLDGVVISEGSLLA